MIRSMPLIALLGLAACNMRSPAPVMTPEEADAYSYCTNYVPAGDAVASGYSDPVAACMKWRLDRMRQK